MLAVAFVTDYEAEASVSGISVTLQTHSKDKWCVCDDNMLKVKSIHPGMPLYDILIFSNMPLTMPNQVAHIRFITFSHN